QAEVKPEDAQEGEAAGDDQAKKEPKRKPVNLITPLWKKKPADITEDEYRDFYHFVSHKWDNYSHVIHYNVDGQVQFNSILYVPESKAMDLMEPEVEYGLALYSKKILIMDHCKDLVPRWMRFVRGVVDSEDIPLNVSRDTIQNNRVIMKINELLVKKLVDELHGLVEKDAKKFESVWKEYNFFIKEGIVSDHKSKERLLPLLRFHTSKTNDGEVKGLDDYIKNMKDQQKEKKEIYYLVGENLAIMKNSPHLGYYQKNDIEVILFDETVDNFLMMNVHDYTVKTGDGDKKEETVYTFKPIDVADEDKKKTEEKKEGDEKKEGEAEPEKQDIPEESRKFLERVKAILGEKIVDAKMSSRLYESPYRLANPSSGMTSSMQRVMRYWTARSGGKEFEVPKKIIEFNPDHAMIKALIDIVAKNPDDARVELVVSQMLDNALLAEGDLPEPVSIVPRIDKLLGLLVSKDN
nr:hypothetical protein [Candidatus Sigynarchaeota archaeon]